MTESDRFELYDQFASINAIDPSFYQNFEVKRGLRNADGSGVVAGATNISNVHGYVMSDGVKVADEGSLLYRGYELRDLVQGGPERRFNYEEIVYLLLLGNLPTHAGLERLVSVIDAEGKKRYEYSPWEPFTVHIDYEAQKELKDVVIGLAIYRNDGAMVYGTNTLIDTAKPVELKEKGSIDLKVENLPVSNGTYVVDLALHKPDGFNYDFWRNICRLEIAGKVQTPGEIALGHSWEVN